MTKPRREVWLALEEAQSALAILKSLIDEQPDIAAIDMRRLVSMARTALDKGQDALSDAVQAAQAALGRI